MIYLKRKAVSTGGENSHILVENSDLNMPANIPQEMGGKKTGGTNPEELFAAGVAGCLTRSFEFLARNKNIKHEGIQVLSEVFLEDNDLLGGFQFRLVIEFKIEGLNETDKNILVKETIGFCPFSRAIKDNIKVDYIIN